MASWDEVRNFIKSNYQVQKDDGDSLILVRDVGRGRTQMMMITMIDLGIEAGDAMITMLSPVAKSNAVSADQVLEMSVGSPFGVRKTTDFYWLTHSQLAATVDPAEIDIPLRYMGVYADMIEGKLSLSDDL
jgi:hypothetical protein